MEESIDHYLFHEKLLSFDWSIKLYYAFFEWKGDSILEHFFNWLVFWSISHFHLYLALGSRFYLLLKKVALVEAMPHC